MKVTIDSKTALLAYVLQYPETSAIGLSPAVELYQNEDYILAYYILLCGEQQMFLTREVLEPALEVNAQRWVQGKSLYSIKFGSAKIGRDYIQTMRPDSQLVNLQEYAKALTEIVLARYDELLEVQVEITSDDLPAIYNSIKLLLQKEGTLAINQNVYNLNSGLVEYLYLGKVKYDLDGIALYMEDATAALKERINAVGKVETYSDKITRHQVESGIFLKDVFPYNLGKQILPNPAYGETTFISAEPKTGKTKFAIGEVAYSAMAEFVNTLYLSTEMSGGDLQKYIILKHIYATTGKRLDAYTVGVILNIIGSRRAKGLTKAQETLLRHLNPDSVEAVTIAEYEIFHSGMFGKLEVVYAGDADDPLSHLFHVENLLTGIISLQNSMSEGEKYGAIIIDHAGGFDSITDLTERLVFNRIYGDAPKIAKYKKAPSHVWVFNHTNTNDAEAIQKGNAKSDDKALFGKKVKAFGSSASGKNAYNDFSFVKSPQQERDGLMTIHVNYIRTKGLVQAYGDDNFSCVAELDVNNFYFQGLENPPYNYKKYDNYKRQSELEEVEE